MKLIIGFVLCVLLWYFWRIAQREQKKYKQLRKKIRDRALGLGNHWELPAENGTRDDDSLEEDESTG